MSKQNCADSRVINDLAKRLEAEGWFDDSREVSEPKYQETPEKLEESWQRLIERLQKDGIWRYEDD